MVIREARQSDAAAMSRVLVASITELCAADHAGDPEAIARWTANKSPDSIGRWLANPAFHVFVAEDEGAILCVGGFNDGGEIQLNYVAPEARFRGVSKAMLSHLERTMSEHGLSEAILTSTETAHELYRSAGWRDHGEPEEKFGLKGHPMTKKLS